MAKNNEGNSKTCTILIFVFLVVELLIGLLCIACGIWFHASQDIYSYMLVFVRSANDGTVAAAAGIMLAIGFILTFLTLLAAFGVFRRKAICITAKMLAIGFILTFLTLLAAFGVFRRKAICITAYMGLIWIVLLLGLIAGFMIVGFRYDIHRFVKEGMMDQLQNQYTWDNKVGKAWNRVQVKKRCCGVDGSWDYINSQYISDLNTDILNQVTFVPTTCCVLNFNQDRELYWVDPQNPQPKDLVRCNTDAQGYKDGSANLHGRGCFAALFGKNKDLWHDQSIFLVMDVITGLCLTAGFLQIFAILIFWNYQRTQQSVNIDSKPGKLGVRY